MKVKASYCMKSFCYCTKSCHRIRSIRNLMIEFPILRSIQAFDIGTPVVLLICRFTFVIPNARFHEKLRPGISVDFFPICFVHNFLCLK